MSIEHKAMEWLRCCPYESRNEGEAREIVRELLAERKELRVAIQEYLYYIEKIPSASLDTINLMMYEAMQNITKVKL